MKLKKYFIFVFFALFMFLGLSALYEGMASPKNERVYSLMEKYIPYSLEKRAGGFSILMKDSNVKEKPPAKVVFKRFERLEQQWARDFLVLDKQTLKIFNKEKKLIATIMLQSQEEVSWVKSYFKIK